MKKTLLSAALLSLCTITTYAQEEAEKPVGNMYLRLGIGYSFAHAAQVDANGTQLGGNVENTTAYSRYQSSKVSFGAGGSTTVALGYMMTPNFGFDLGVNVGVINRKHRFTTSDFISPAETSAGEGQIYSKMRLTVLPSVVLQAAVGNLNVYSRLGVALPVMAKLAREYKEQYTSLGGTYEVDNVGEYTTRFGTGFQGALGVSFPLGFGSVWAEATGVSMNLYAKTFVYDKYTINGADVLGTMIRADKEIEYDFDVTDHTSASSPDETSKGRTFALPFSSIGVAVGFTFGL